MFHSKTIELPNDKYDPSSSPSKRRTLKAFTQLETYIIDPDWIPDNIHINGKLITSTRRHFSVDEASPMFNANWEEEMKMNETGKRTENKKKKFIAEFHANINILENVKIIDREMSIEIESIIKNTLLGHFLFCNMDMVQIEGCVRKMFPCEVKKNQNVFRQGDHATSFYIVESGTLEVRVNDNVKRYLKRGDGFGELALLYNSPRSATIFPIEDSILWGIDRNNFRKVVQETIIKEFSINRKFISGVEVFNCLSNQQKDELAGCIISEKFNEEQIIVNEGDPANCFYIIKEGILHAFKGEKFIRELKEGDSFGESALLYDTTRQMTIVAKTNCIILALPKIIISQILGDQVGIIAFRNLQKWGLEKSAVFKDLTSVQRERIIDRMTIKYEKAGSILFQKNELIKKRLVILHEGIVTSKKGDKIFQKGTIWGAEDIYQDTERKYTDDHIFVINGIISVIESNSLEEILGNKLEIIIKKNMNSHERKIKYSLLEAPKTSNLKLENLIFIKKLGFGHYGNVYLVKDNIGKELYALKAISKQRILENRIEKHLQQEKTVLELISFPFIVNFVKSLKDEINIYFLMEYIKGMDLFDVIRQLGLLNTYDAQYYIGSLILAIEYLHLNNIVHRDIKPENIMVDHNGSTKLIDMGTAKFLNRSSEKNFQKAFTIIGTPHYMAPEIVKSKGYSFAVDYWSIGICFYEFMCGMLPFGEDTEDPYEIYEEILKKEMKYPSYLYDKKGRRLMNQLLSKVPEVRVNGSIGAIKADPWFGNFDWDGLMEGTLKPPYICDEFIKNLETEIREKEKDDVLIKEFITSELNLSPGKMKIMVTKIEENWEDFF